MSNPAAARTVARLSLANMHLVWATTAVLLALATVPSVIQVVQAGPGEYFENSYLISSGNALLVLPLMAPIVVAVGHRAKLMNLHAAKNDLLSGAVVLYALLAAAVAAGNSVLFHVVDRSWAHTFQVMNLADVFGWTSHGIIVGFLQQLAALTLVSVAIHTLASAQRSWVGRASLLALIVLVGASLVVTPLVRARQWLLDLLLFHPEPLVQIGSCLVATALMTALAWAVVRRVEL